MGVKTTAFRRIFIYIAEHSICKDELGMESHLDLSTVVKKIEIYPDDKAIVTILDPHGYERKKICRMKD